MTVFFTGDTHFGDPRVLRIDRRPFANVQEHDAGLISRWNAVVGQEDTVWHLGDFALAREEFIRKVFNKLNGHKHLIIGNNDGPATVSGLAWASVQHYAEINLDGTQVVLCHYPFRTWNKMGRGVVDLHGHSHGALGKPHPRQFDVGVDVFDFRPVELTTILTSRKRGRARESTTESAAC